MSRIWDFHGGIHPPENKQQSLQRPLEQAPLPPQLILPLQQHIGSPAEPLVEIGDKVLKGQPIAKPTGHISAYLHAPTSGTISAIDSYPVAHPSGMSGLCIVLDSDGEDRWIERSGIEDYRTLEKAELVALIQKAGIAGMGGAGFPTQVKLHLADDHIVNTLIINGVECEPYITADDLLMRERAEQVIGGIEIAAHLIKPTHILVGIEDNKPEAAVAMQQAARASELDIEVVVVPTKYPSGGEKQLIKLLTGVEVPFGKIPADIGIVLQNVGTMAAVYQAVHDGTPLISRITTLTGEALSEPGNREILIGTPVEFLLQHAGVKPEQLKRLVLGGPMMGFTLSDTAIPVVKTSNCIIAGSITEFPEQPLAQNCIRCGQCEQVCPAQLLPQQLHWFSKGKEFAKAQSYNLMDCIECGACAYVCPSNIPLVQYYRFAKGEIRREKYEQQKAEQARIRFEARQARLEQAEQEKAARRKARAEESARKIAAKKAEQEAQQPAGSEQTASSPSEAELKIAVASARTKLTKSEKALAAAQEKGSATAETLQGAVERLRAKLEQAERDLAAAGQADAASSEPQAVPALGELKVAAASARTKLKKTEKALAAAQEKGSASAANLEAAVERLKAKVEQAEQALATAEQQASATATDGTESTPSLSELKVAAASSRTKLQKTEKALAAAREKGSASAANLEAAVERLKTKAEQAEQALATAEQQANQGTM